MLRRASPALGPKCSYAAGADVVLGMIPLARELLRMGSEVVMVANSLPAINDVTCAELRTLLESVCETCPILKVCLPLTEACLWLHV